VGWAHFRHFCREKNWLCPSTFLSIQVQLVALVISLAVQFGDFDQFLACCSSILTVPSVPSLVKVGARALVLNGVGATNCLYSLVGGNLRPVMPVQTYRVVQKNGYPVLFLGSLR